MQRTVVIRMHGDKAIGEAIASGIEFRHIKELEARLGIRNENDAEKYRRLIAEIPTRFPIRNHGRLYHRFWTYVATLWIIHTEGRIS